MLGLMRSAFVCALFVAPCLSVPVSQTHTLSGWIDPDQPVFAYALVDQLDRLKRSIDFEQFASPSAFFSIGADAADLTVTCTACKAAMQAVRFFLAEGFTEAELIEFLHSICVDLNIMTTAVCDGFTRNVGPEIVAVLNATKLTPLEVCSFLMKDNCGEVASSLDNWNITMPDTPKPPLGTPDYPSDGGNVVRVLHLSDTHIDLKYAEGSPADCNEPLCCRIDSQSNDGSSEKAGYWGSRKCDTPVWAMDNLLEHVAQTHKDIDYIIWTGDLPSHDIWDQTRDSTLEILRLTADKIRTAFPNIPVYPAIGNHDSAPVNSFPQPEVGGAWNMSWLYDVIWEEWGSEWLATNETLGTIRKGAFYSTLARPGLRIISLNMNFCYTNNWWLVVNSTDPAQELSWLAEELQKAENAGEKVHILGHIPPAVSDCMDTWSKHYVRLLTRYEGTVTAQFFGHTHKDEFQVFYDLENSTRPVAVSFIGPSVTTFTDLNPGYRIYDIDGEREGSTRLVLNHETWIYDLDAANLGGQPEWKQNYKLKEEYGFKTLLPEDYHQLYLRLKGDNELINRYNRHLMKESPVTEHCNEECGRKLLCRIRSCSLYPELD